MDLPAFDDLPLLTSAVPGTGGTLKTHPSDFVVEELPAYQPSGTGEHLFLWIEKTDVSAERLIQLLSRKLGVSRRDIGVAGQKDRRAVTRQFVSVPAVAESRLDRVDGDGLCVLDATRHPNKLRTGHLRGNRFSILVRGSRADAFDCAKRVAQQVSALGFPNFFGRQRFGADGRTLQTGFDLLLNRLSSQELPASSRRYLLRLSLSAAQAALFNQVVRRRLNDSLLHTVLKGDRMQVVQTGGTFPVEDAGFEQRRFDSRETAITGPIFGHKMREAAAESLERELQVLRDSGLTPDVFHRFKKLTPGTRRPMLIWPDGLTVSQEQDGLRFEFSLPAGTYATVLMNEFLKSKG